MSADQQPEMTFDEASAILAERNKGNLGPEADWSPEKIGRALRYIHVLANTPHKEWRTKRAIHAALAEFRDGPLTPRTRVSFNPLDADLTRG